MASPPIQLVSLSRRERGANIEIGSFNKNKKHTDKARWICIYPSYINSKKTRAQGRKLAAKTAVENPTINEIRDVLVNAGLRVELEVNKVHPKEPNKYEMLSRGRIRVHLKNDDGTPVKSNLTTRDALLVYVAETIPKLKTRGSGGAQASSSAEQSKSGGGGGGGKKSNKKK